MEPEHRDDAGAPPGGGQQGKCDTIPGFISAAKQSAQEGLMPKWLMPFFTWFKKEWLGFKAGRSLLIILVIAGVVISALLTHKYENTKIESLNSRHANSNSFLLGMIAQNENDKKASDTKIQDLKADLNRLTTEKAAAEQRAAIFEAIPLQVPSIITNISNLLATAPTNQQQLLHVLSAVEALTNSLTEVTLRPTFDLYINQTKITNGTVLDLMQSRMLNMRVHNTSSISAEQLSVAFYALTELDPTNIVFNGWWMREPAYISGPDVEPTTINSANHWLFIADKLLNSGGYFAIPSLQISTNFHRPVTVVWFEIYAARSKRADYRAILKF